MFVVQLVLAKTGCRFPLEVRPSRSASFFVSSSLASTSHLSLTTSTGVFVSDVVSCVRGCRSEPQNDLYISENKQDYVEMFDYNTLQPLFTNDSVVEGQKLLLFAPSSLCDVFSNVLPRRWRQNAGEAPGPQADDEERRQNLRRAVLALEVSLNIHQNMMETEMEKCARQVETTTAEFATVRGGIQKALEEIKNRTLFYSPDTPVSSMVDVNSFFSAVAQGEAKLREAGEMYEEARALTPGVVERIREEVQVAKEFKKTSAWNSSSSLTTTEQGDVSSAVSALMMEVNRKVEVVRNIIDKIARITKQLQRCRHHCNAIARHVLLRHQGLCLLPSGLNAAKEVLERRVILRRAIRRLLVLLEAEYCATETSIRKFSEEWKQWLPENIFKVVSSPLPPLYPPNDSIAQEMDRHFVNVNKDETEELLAAVGVGLSSNEQEHVMERRMRELEAELQHYKTTLEAIRREKAEVESALRKLQASTLSSLSQA